MNREDIIKMADASGLSLYGMGKDREQFIDYLECFADFVASAEREACAKVCDELPAPDIYSHTDKSMWDVTCMDCAAAIRARGKEPCVHEWIDDTKAKPAWRCIKCGSDYKKEQA